MKGDAINRFLWQLIYAIRASVANCSGGPALREPKGGA